MRHRGSRPWSTSQPPIKSEMNRAVAPPSSAQPSASRPGSSTTRKTDCGAGGNSMVSVAAATYMLPDDRVFGVSINGQHRAYPLRIMNRHEMANDVLGGVPFALAY